MWSIRTSFIATVVGLITACACSKSAARDTPTLSGRQGATTAVTGSSATKTDRKLINIANGRALASHAVVLAGAGDAKDKLRPYLHQTAARATFDAGKWQQCTVQMRAWLKSNPKHPQRRAAAIMASLCDEHAGHASVAAANYEMLSAKGGLLKDILNLRAAESWLAAGEADKAIAALRRLPTKGFARKLRATEISGRAWRQKGDLEKAFSAYENVAKSPGASVSLLFDTAQAAASIGKGNEEAKWLRTILSRYPGQSREAKAKARLAQLPKAQARLTDGELLARASNARRLHKRKLALTVAEELMARSAAGEKPWCEAGLIKARVLETWWPRRKEAAALYDDLSKRCPKHKWSVKLRYRAAKRQMNSASQQRALALFDEVAQVAPGSSLIDDAMRYQARILRQLGRTKDADKKLEAILGLGGDMVEYAGWDLLWQQVTARNWRRCIAMGKRVIATSKGATKRYNVGRPQYWTAMCELHSGHKRAARQRFSRVAKRTPRSWYGMLAAQRLRQLSANPRHDKNPATKGPAAPANDLLRSNRRLLTNPHFVAGIELLRLGMKTSAAQELAAVNWNKKEASEGTLRALLYSAVGEHTKATAIAARNRAFDGNGKDVNDNRQGWLLAYPRPSELAPLVAEQATKSRVDPMFIWAIMRSESRFNRRATSPVLATGLLQLMPATAKTVAKRLGDRTKITRTALMQPALNIRLGTVYMRRLLDRMGGHYALVSSGYNAGPHNTRKWQKRWRNAQLDEFVERIPFRENRRYVKSVVTSWLRYRALYGKGNGPEIAMRLSTTGVSRKVKASRRR